MLVRQDLGGTKWQHFRTSWFLARVTEVPDATDTIALQVGGA